MPDYGHELAFGTFLTPQQPAGVVTLAQLTERAAFYLVSFQDHPNQPAFLDAVVMVAAQTRTLKVAPNVLNLRHPQMPGLTGPACSFAKGNWRAGPCGEEGSSQCHGPQRFSVRGPEREVVRL